MTWVNRKRYFFNSYDIFFQKKGHRKISKYSDLAVRRCFSKEVFWKISQYSQENTCVRVLESLFNKIKGLQLCNVIKNRLHHRCFLTFFYRTPPVVASECWISQSSLIFFKFYLLFVKCSIHRESSFYIKGWIVKFISN